MGLNVLSLCDGISCGRVALDKLGLCVDSYYSCEIDKFSIKASEDNYSDIIRLGDINTWHSWDIDYDSIDLIFAGFPCQSFSFAGKGKGFDDDRGGIFFKCVSILNHVKAKNPNVKFLFENVKMKVEYSDFISKELGVTPVNINSRLVSAQNRERLYWFNWDCPRPDDLGISLCDILEDNVEDKYFHSDKAVEYMNRVGSTDRVKWSFKFHSDTINEKSSCVTANFFKGVPNNVLVCDRQVGRRLCPITGKRKDSDVLIPIVQRFEARRDDKSGTITTVQKDNLVGIKGIPVSVRRFTPVEVERLQTLPDGYTKVLSDTQRYKSVGNGWTVDVIKHILSFSNIK